MSDPPREYSEEDVKRSEPGERWYSATLLWDSWVPDEGTGYLDGGDADGAYLKTEEEALAWLRDRLKDRHPELQPDGTISNYGGMNVERVIACRDDVDGELFIDSDPEFTSYELPRDDLPAELVAEATRRRRRVLGL